MPQFDGTGPIGRGPMSGRGMGYCAVRVSPPARTAWGGGAPPGPHRPATAGSPGVTAYGMPGPFYRGSRRGLRIGYGRGFGRRGGRGRGGGRRW
jgi:hypothetical protein